MASRRFDSEEIEYLSQIHSDMVSWLEKIYVQNISPDIKVERLIEPWLTLLIYYSFQAWNFVEIIKSESLTLIHGDSEHLARPSNTKDFFDSCFDGRLNDLAIEISSKIKGVKCIAVKADRCNVKKADIRSNKLKAQCLNAIIKAKFNLLNCIPDVFFGVRKLFTFIKLEAFLNFALGNLFTKKWKLLGSIASENFINNEQFLTATIILVGLKMF